MKKNEYIEDIKNTVKDLSNSLTEVISEIFLDFPKFKVKNPKNDPTSIDESGNIYYIKKDY